MLKYRIITALILMPLVILAIFKLPHAYFAGIFAVILCLGAWEWARLSGIKTQIAKSVYVLAIAVVLLVLMAMLHRQQQLISYFLYIYLFWWLFCIYQIVRFNQHPRIYSVDTFPNHLQWMSAVAGVFILTGTFIGFIGIRLLQPDGSVLLLLCMILIWVADSAAYFTGRAIGKHKLALNVSPGKSWEGVIGALIATGLVAIVMSLYLSHDFNQMLRFLLVSLITIVFSIAGDLTESLYKRQIQIKDSGTILPGHGGIMDRLDSLTAASPIFLLCVTSLVLK